MLIHCRVQAAVERSRRRESIELAAMQAYEEKLQKQEEERRRQSAGAVQSRFLFIFFPWGGGDALWLPLFLVFHPAMRGARDVYFFLQSKKRVLYIRRDANAC